MPKHCAQLPYLYSTQQLSTAHPVWRRSAHTRLIDRVLNDALRIVTGCLRLTPTDHLPLLYDLLSGSLDARQKRLRSRRPLVPA